MFDALLDKRKVRSTETKTDRPISCYLSLFLLLLSQLLRHRLGRESAGGALIA